MSLPTALESVRARFISAQSYKDVFGDAPTGNEDAQVAYLKQQFRYLAKVLHPDGQEPKYRKEAEQLFAELNRLHSNAVTALKEGRYSKPFGKGFSAIDDGGTFDLTSSLATYRLSKTAFAKGDFSVLYRGVRVTGSSEQVIAKVARAPATNAWLENEAKILMKFRDAKSGDPLSGITRFVPNLADAFLVEGAGNKRYRVLITKAVDNLVSVADIIAVYPKGLDPRDASWIYRRIIAQTLAASMVGVVHGAIVPDHILVGPITHNPLHIGWAHALSSGHITHIIPKYKDYYPREVFDRRSPDHTTDLYMASKTMIHLLGGDVKRNALPSTVPKRVGEVILRSVASSPASRPQDGKQLLDDFTRVIKEEWGRTYRALTMPVR